ncbi:MAG: hypothetical protein RMK18_12950, partial [Armatimonadota bacterium]|nr:hypothetical protein [Armatimonadota bacterium]
FVGADDSLPEETVAKNSTNRADFIRRYIQLRNSYESQKLMFGHFGNQPIDDLATPLQTNFCASVKG